MNPRKITPLREADITRSIAREFYKEFDELSASDVIVIGGGPSGLVCARELALQGYKTHLVEQMNHLGGGFWSGGYLMSKAAIAWPARAILLKLGVPCPDGEPGLHLVE